MSEEKLKKALRYRWLIFWILAVSYIMVYFHRLCPAVVAEDMRRDLATGGGLLGLLGSAYFYPYALMQLPDLLSLVLRRMSMQPLWVEHLWGWESPCFLRLP